MNRKQKLALIISILASGVAFLDGAIVNVALPAIQRDLGGGLSTQQWIVDAYLLTLGSLILIAGSLSDLLGRKRILGLGLWGFGIASLLCAAAPTGTALIIFRGLQGLAGALLVPSSLALIMSTFKGPGQGKAIGNWTAWTGIAFVIGPLLGGFLVDQGSWRWIFAINVLPIALTLYLLKRVKTGLETEHAKVDVIGALLCALGLGGPVFALIEQSRYGWSDPLIYVPLIGGLILFIAFLLYEARVAAPMLPLGLFKRRNFSVGNAATTAVYAGLTVGTFILAVFLQQAAGYSALAAGLALLPVTIIMFLLSPRFGALAGRYGPRLFMGLGPLIGGAGYLMMLNIGTDLNYWIDLLPGICVFGLGLSITVAPLTAAILSDVPTAQSGIASAINNAVARVAGLLAIAAVGVIMSAQFSATISNLNTGNVLSPVEISQRQQAPLQGRPDDSHKLSPDEMHMISEASVSAFHAGLTTVAVLLIAGGLISLAGIKNPKST